MKSMTGYGRGAAERAGLRVVAEISSVNRRQLDVAANLPREWAAHEGTVRRVVAAAVTRGRINVKITVERAAGGSRTVVADQALFNDYVARLGELTGGRAQPGASDILRMPGVIELRETETPAEEVDESIAAAIGDALAGWNQMREAEGRHLLEDTARRLQAVESTLPAMEALAADVVVNYRKLLHARLAQAGVPIDLGDDRILREIGLFADRCDISEELTRLRSHLAKFRDLGRDTEPPGRPMDFLLQEMNREINTIGAKANDARLAQHVVAVKTELEKIREQIQNIE